jgi:hypothetical protein
MSVRDTINNHSGLVAAGVIVLILAVLAVGWYAMPESGMRPSAGTAYYTTDEGKTYQSGDPKGISPITIDGKQAYRAYLYECEGGKPFVGYMERYKPEYKAVLEQARVDLNNLPVEKRGLYMSAEMSGREMLVTGEKTWRAMTPIPPMIKCPDGKIATPKP